MDLRRPPALPHWSSERGFCRWCGEEILKDYRGNQVRNRRRHWHPACVQLYNVATSSSSARWALLGRDKGVCAGCGFDTQSKTQWVRDMGLGRSLDYYYDIRTGEKYLYTAVCLRSAVWHADHIVPLWLVDRTLPWLKLIVYWLLENLQTLCEDCHKIKTAREAAQRAKMKRLQGRALYQKRPRRIKKPTWTPRPPKLIN